MMLSTTDVNECEMDNGGCEQQCRNINGSFFCSCGPSYSLQSDGKTCLLLGNVYTCIGTFSCIPCSCNFSWHNIFMNFMSGHPMPKIFLTKIYNSSQFCSGRGFRTLQSRNFCRENLHLSDCQRFSQIFDHESLELFGSLCFCENFVTTIIQEIFFWISILCVQFLC